ncbi:hypothetical protein D3C87_1377020 [compost metagenome]
MLFAGQSQHGGAIGGIASGKQNGTVAFKKASYGLFYGTVKIHMATNGRASRNTHTVTIYCSNGSRFYGGVLAKAQVVIKYSSYKGFMVNVPEVVRQVQFYFGLASA